jgi:crotonobetainyl-CoA:carnitine CoA-transferase CaiB-like acyl-CoA transferase
MKPLEGIRCSLSSRIVADPPCPRGLGGFGADGVKVQRPGGRDSLRAHSAVVRTTSL